MSVYSTKNLSININKNTIQLVDKRDMIIEIEFDDMSDLVEIYKVEMALRIATTEWVKKNESE